MLFISCKYVFKTFLNHYIYFTDSKNFSPTIYGLDNILSIVVHSKVAKARFLLAFVFVYLLIKNTSHSGTF